MLIIGNQSSYRLPIIRQVVKIVIGYPFFHFFFLFYPLVKDHYDHRDQFFFRLVQPIEKADTLSVSNNEDTYLLKLQGRYF